MGIKMRRVDSSNSKYNNLIYIVLIFIFGLLIGISITACVIKSEIEHSTNETINEPNVQDDTQEVTVFVEPETEASRNVYYPKERDILSLAKALYGDCQNLVSREAKESIAWCLLNRYDTCRYSSIRALVTAPYEVLGYSDDNEITEEYYHMARDILIKWHNEKETNELDESRTLSREYIYYVLSPDDVEFITSWYDSKGIVMQ